MGVTKKLVKRGADVLEQKRLTIKGEEFAANDKFVLADTVCLVSGNNCVCLCNSDKERFSFKYIVSYTGLVNVVAAKLTFEFFKTANTFGDYISVIGNALFGDIDFNDESRKAETAGLQNTAANFLSVYLSAGWIKRAEIGDEYKSDPENLTREKIKKLEQKNLSAEDLKNELFKEGYISA